eukprot:gene8659-biopygen19658
MSPGTKELGGGTPWEVPYPTRVVGHFCNWMSNWKMSLDKPRRSSWLGALEGATAGKVRHSRRQTRSAPQATPTATCRRWARAGPGRHSTNVPCMSSPSYSPRKVHLLESVRPLTFTKVCAGSEWGQ